MKRKIYNDLIKWKEQTSHKPLMILGVRQCGKTYIINEFCQNEYKNVVQINLLQRDDIVKLYETDLTSDEKFNRLKLILNSELEAEDIIFFIDEIQVSEKLIAELKYFCECFVTNTIKIPDKGKTHKASKVIGKLIESIITKTPITVVIEEIICDIL